MMGSSSQYRSRFGDTTLTKVFVGGLAWETPSETLRRHFDQFGEILEAVVITDKTTGRSKGYGFVTFREPESARRACLEANPIIDGRRANCNIASRGLPRPSPRGRVQVGIGYQGGSQHAIPPPYSRIPPPAAIFPPYGYMAYPADYGYQQAVYNPQFQHHMYGGPTSPSRVGSPYPPYSPVGYTVQISPRAGFPLVQHMPRQQQPPQVVFPQGYVQYPPSGHVVGTSPFIPSSSSHHSGFQLQAPPPRQTQTTPVSDSNPTQQQPSMAEASSTEDKEDNA